ncbi:MAG: DegT/DnrJ/EryC1/StrS family aminotransferase, partial [Anaerolineaceae bacterium]
MSIHLGASYDALLHGAAPDLAGPEFNPNDLSRLTYFRGRVALAAILRGIGVRVGDEVLIQGFTCTAVPEAVLSLGARPRYVDVEGGGPNMDADDLARKITARSAAVVIQHTFGLPADVTRLLGVAREWGVPLVEDCAHTIASRVDGRTVGSFGAAAFYSYEASKPMFIGIGGSAVCNDAGLADALTLAYGDYAEPSAATQLQLAAMFLAHRVAYRPSAYWMVRALYRRLVVAGILRGNYNRVADETGPALDFGRRMGRTQAALLLRALKRLDAQSLHRRWVADHYRTGIRATGVAHIPVATNADPVFGRY